MGDFGAAVYLWRANLKRPAVALIVLSVAFLCNMAFVVSSRTVWICLPFLLLLFALLHFKLRGALIVLAIAVVAGAVFWASSPYLRLRASDVAVEYEEYHEQSASTSTGLRLEYLAQSRSSLSKKHRLIGNGTGSTKTLFERDAVGKQGVSAEIIGNPHNQTLNVAVQWGLLGCIVLYAMWLAHLKMFLTPGLVSWIGLAAVVENFVSSLFNSHLFDFGEGWIYVLAVGVAGGMLSGIRRFFCWRWFDNDTKLCCGKADAPMTRPFAHLTWRNVLIATHDALATIGAVFVSFYLRFESGGLLERLPLLWRILPYFVLLSIVVCYVFKLTVTKWRFISLPDLLNIVKVSTVLALALLVLDYIFIAPNVYGTFFFGKTTIIIYWFLQIFALGGTRVAYRYFRYTRTINRARNQNAAPTLLIGRAADAEVLLRGIESGAVKRMWPVGILSPSQADRGQSIRNIPVLGGVDDLADDRR